MTKSEDPESIKAGAPNLSGRAWGKGHGALHSQRNAWYDLVT